MSVTLKIGLSDGTREFILQEIKEETLKEMVSGLSVPFNDLMRHPLVRKYGHYVGGFRDEWVWDKIALRGASLNHVILLIQLLDKGE